MNAVPSCVLPLPRCPRFHSPHGHFHPLYPVTHVLPLTLFPSSPLASPLSSFYNPLVTPSLISIPLSHLSSPFPPFSSPIVSPHTTFPLPSNRSSSTFPFHHCPLTSPFNFLFLPLIPVYHPFPFPYLFLSLLSIHPLPASLLTPSSPLFFPPLPPP